MKLKIKKDIR